MSVSDEVKKRIFNEYHATEDGRHKLWLSAHAPFKALMDHHGLMGHEILPEAEFWSAVQAHADAAGIDPHAAFAALGDLPVTAEHPLLRRAA